MGVSVGTSQSRFRLPTLVRKRNKHANFDPPLAWLSLFTSEYGQRYISWYISADQVFLRTYVLRQIRLRSLAGNVYLSDLDHFTGSSQFPLLLSSKKIDE